MRTSAGRTLRASMRHVQKQIAALLGRLGKCAQAKSGERREHQRFFLGAKDSFREMQDVDREIGVLPSAPERAKKAVEALHAAMVDMPPVTKHRPFGEPITAGAPVSVLMGAPGTFNFGPGTIDMGPFPIPGAGGNSMAGRRVRFGEDIFRILIWKDRADAS
ncbi:hypothetical protein [Mesorhizobium sp. Cs1321R2N1]|uniref:hypothetical protein n=1 Tax=Mesorhizobium sp. Cs1321R2N1 TaxID=3015174 RepID=UPI00301C381C